jgi:NAD(P)-dependent dehydrogenase (short-subunit alcohol dehydrogenase family)
VTSIDLAKTPSFRLDGRRALVTGGGRGIGLAAAAALAEAGAQVTLAARTGREIEEAASAIRARGGEAEALVLDVTDVEAARRALAVAATPFQILVNNAGTNRPVYFPDVKVEDFDAIFALNVSAAFFIAQAVALRLIKTRLPGSIINISSQMGHVGLWGQSAFSSHGMNVSASRCVLLTSRSTTDALDSSQACRVLAATLRVLRKAIRP